jgi:thiosulfate/3-mercaptopyruvate sulfurtransferase
MLLVVAGTSLSGFPINPCIYLFELLSSKKHRLTGGLAGHAVVVGVKPVQSIHIDVMTTDGYAKDVLVSPEFVTDRLDEFQSDDPEYRLVEVDVDTEAYDEAHAPGAIGFNWETQLQDPTTRDILDKEDFETLLGDHGISEDSTVVIYGDNSNWFASYTYWQFKYYGHDDVRLLNGARDYWLENDYPVTDEVPEYPAVEYEARGPFESIRAYRDDVDHAIDQDLPLVDVRSPEEFSGEILAPPGLNETAQRGGHIPGASNISWADTVNDDGTFKSAEELESIYADYDIDGSETTVAYCRIGERSSIAWFALHELLGYDEVVNYDGSWTEWGNLVGAPIETGKAD